MTRPVASPFDNKVTIDNWSATDGPVPLVDEFDCAWVMQNIEGWFGGVDVRGTPIDRPLADGTFDGIAPFTGRTITVTGTVIAPSRNGLQDAFDRLAGVLSGVVRRSTLVVFEAIRNVTRQAEVRLGGPVLIKRTGTLTAEFSLQMYASDPLRYSTDVKSASTTPFAASGGRTYNLVPPRRYGASGSTGILNAYNAGNRPAWARLEVSGVSALNPRIVKVATGEFIQVNVNVGSLPGQPLVIDMRNRLITMGTNTYFPTNDSTWFQLSPGANQLYYSQSAASSSSLLTAYWQDAYS